ncbi:ribosomal protein S18-alanine N-acetyltransferase [Chloroflexota bacterium]
MPYSIRLMHRDDLSQVTGIDQEAFSTQWPPTNYKNELQNQLAHYIVACDETKTIAKPPAKVRPDRGLYGLIFKIRRWLGHNCLSGKEPNLAKRQYIVGFAGIWVMADEAHITNIAVRKSYQRRGLGELLLISLSDLAKELKADIITLEVRASNVAAQNLYYKYAFTEVGTRYGYYNDNREDGLIMSTESIASASFQAQLNQLKQTHRKKWGTVNRQLSI